MAEEHPSPKPHFPAEAIHIFYKVFSKATLSLKVSIVGEDAVLEISNSNPAIFSIADAPEKIPEIPALLLLSVHGNEDFFVTSITVVQSS